MKRQEKPQYFGVLLIKAVPCGRIRLDADAPPVDGYSVEYPNGTFAWMDKETFESHFTMVVHSEEQV